MEKQTYTANKLRKEFHSNDCPWVSLMAKRNKETHFPSFKEALFEGYDSCGHCLSQFNEMIIHGYLIVNHIDTEVNIEFICPGYKLLFIKNESNNLNIKVKINQKKFVFDLQKNKDKITYEASKNEYVTKDQEELNPKERDVLQLFLKALNKEFAYKAKEIKKQVLPIGKVVMFMLSFDDIPEEIDHRFNDCQSKSLVDTLSRYNQIKEAYKNAPDLTGECNGKTVDYFLGKDRNNEDTKDGIDITNFVQTRRPTRAVYKGESVQAWWTSETEWKKTWGIVGGKNGDTTWGGTLSDNLLGDIDIIISWLYGAVDHDTCQSYEEACLKKPCFDEFLIGALNELASVFTFEDTDGNNPPKELVITNEEKEKGEYVYEEEHPMAGRKIGTPSDWIIDFNNKKWKARFKTEIKQAKAKPNPFDQTIGTNIYFNLNYIFLNEENEEKYKDEKVKVVIELYHKNALEIIPAKVLSLNCYKGENHIYWDGINRHGMKAAIGFYKAVFKVNGQIKFEKEEFLKKVIKSTNSIPASDKIDGIKFSPDPFNIKTGTNIYFNLKDNAKVSLYVYHEKWERSKVKTIFENKQFAKGKQGPFAWNGRNENNIEVTNGEYKVKFIVDGEEKIIKGLTKKMVVSNQTNNHLPSSNIIKDIHFSPNPFTINEETKINFYLQEPALVSIYIYHVNWEKKSIKTLVENKKYGKGPQEEPWNGKNNLGGKTTNGEYKVKFIVNGEEKIKRGLKKERPKRKVWSWKKKKWVWV